MAAPAGVNALLAPRVPRRMPSWPVPLLLLSLQFGGVNVPLSGRAPVLLLFDVMLAGVLLFLGAECVFGDYWPDLSDREWLLPAGICFTVQLISALANPDDVFKSAMVLKIFACGIVVYVIALSSRRPFALLRALVLFGAVTGATLIVAFIFGWQGLLAGEGARALKNSVELPMGFHNYLAAMLVFLLPVALGLAPQERGGRRAACYAAAALMTVGLVITMSRGAFLALLAAALVCAPLLLRAGVRARHFAGFAVAVLLLAPLAPRELIDANTYLFVDRLEHTDVDRLAIYRLAGRTFFDNPLLGVGPGQFVDLTADLNIENDQRLTAHDIVLNSLAETGLLGALPFLWWIAVVARRSWRLATRRCSPLTVSLWVGLLATLFANLVDAPLAGQHYLVVYCVFAAAVTLLGREAGLLEPRAAR